MKTDWTFFTCRKHVVIEIDLTMIGLGLGIAFKTKTFAFWIPFLLITGDWRNL
jgi:hypothetical protein